MARPTKHGLDYFPFDIDFFSDEKIVAIAVEFGIKGEITIIKLLCAVYRNGYFIEWNEMMKFKLLKELPGVSADLLNQIIQRLVKWDFFDKSLFDTASILTSRGIQRRYQTISVKMRRKNAITEYSLIDIPQPATPQEKPPTATKKNCDAEPRLTAQAMTTTPAHAAAKPSTPAVSLDESVEAMLSDSIWREPVCMRYNLTSEQFKRAIANFKLHCMNIERLQHNNVADAKRHFCTLLSQGKLDDYNTQTTNSDNSADYTYSGGFGGKDI